MADELIIRVSADIKKYDDALKEISSKTKNLEDKLTSVAKTSAIAFAGLSAAVFGVVSAYAVQEQAEIKTRQTIKATGEAAGLSAEEIFKMAEALQNVTKFGDEAIIGGQNLLLTFKNIGKDVFPRTTEIMLDMSEAMGQDLKSSAIQLGKALNDPTVGLTALSRVGITFSDQQKDLIKTLQDTGDIAGAQKIILKELESQFGGVARASASGTGQIIQLKNIMGDLSEDIGRELLPALLPMVKGLKAMFLTLRENQTLVKTAASLLLIGTALTGVTTVVVAGVLGFIKLRKAILAAQIAVKGMTFSIRSLISATGIGLLIVVLTDLAVNWESRFSQMQVIFKTFAKNITNIGQGIATFFKGVFNLDTDQIKQGFNQVKSAVVESFEEIVSDPAFSADKNQMLETLLPGPETVEEKAEESTNAIMEARVAQVEALIEQDEELKAMLNELKAEEREKAVEELTGDLETEQDMRNKAIKDRFKAQQLSNKKFLEDQKKFGTAYANINRVMHSEIYQGSKKAFGELAQLTQSSNETLKGIGKVAAIANIVIKTAESAMNVYNGFSTIPIIGPALGIAGAAAAVAFGAEQIGQVRKARKGMVITGGVPGVDSVPVIAQQNELISPAQNFEEVIGSVRAKRAADEITGGSGGGMVGIHVTYDSPEASQIVTVRQVEDSALGISRDSFRETA
jgi:hypothetical protein